MIALVNPLSFFLVGGDRVHPPRSTPPSACGPPVFSVGLHMVTVGGTAVQAVFSSDLRDVRSHNGVATYAVRLWAGWTHEDAVVLTDHAAPPWPCCWAAFIHSLPAFGHGPPVLVYIPELQSFHPAPPIPSPSSYLILQSQPPPSRSPVYIPP